MPEFGSTQSTIRLRVGLKIALLSIAAFGLSCDRWTLPPREAQQTPVAVHVEPFDDVEFPNVVWIVLDACRPDHLSCYGYPRPTSPNIDRLARRGTAFSRHYAQAPATLMSVPSYMTGRHAPVLYHDPGARNSWFLRPPPDDEVLISSIFSDNGYVTAMFSASPWYSESSRLGRSFDRFEWLTHGPNTGEGSFDERNPLLFEWLEANRATPFFLYVHSMDTHPPRYENNTADTWLESSFPARRDAALRDWSGAPYTKLDQQHLTDLYDGGIEYADRTIGEIVDKLEAMGIRERTVIIVSADHGEILGRDIRTLGHPDYSSHDDMLRVPLIISGPGFPIDRRVHVKTENADIVPTLVDLLSLRTPARFDGLSLKPLLDSKSPDELHRYVFARSKAWRLSSEPNRILIYDDIKFDMSPLEPADVEALGTLPRDKTQVWWVPDYAGLRKAATPPEDRSLQALKIVNERFADLWSETEALVPEIPAYFDVSHVPPVDESLIATEDDPEDGLWMSGRTWVSGATHRVRLLVSHHATEDAPELELRVEVPNGTYAVSIYAMTIPDGPEPRGSSFSFRASDEGDTYRIFTLEAAGGGEMNEAWIELGTYTVQDGAFRYWLDEGRPADDTAVGDLRFVLPDRSHEVPSEVELNAMRDRIRSLGYTD